MKVRLKSLGIAPVFLLLLGLGACKPSSSGTTTTPPPATVTQVITGTVNPGGRDIHNFNLAANSDVTVTLTSVNPAGIPVGIGIGAPQGSDCVISDLNSSVTTLAGTTPQLHGSAQAGLYCIAVFDVGGLPGPASYSVSVAVTPNATTLNLSAARFTGKAVNPTLPALPAVRPSAPLISEPVNIEIISPTPPSTYVPLISKEGFEAVYRDQVIGSRQDSNAVTVEDLTRAHGSPGVIKSTSRSKPGY